MAEYIDREEIYKRWNAMTSPASAFSLCIAINQTPAADVAPVRHGKWIKRRSWDFHVCSECSFETSPSKFCPNCGARMDGGGCRETD